MLEAFREDPKEYSRDLAVAFERHGAQKPGAIAEQRQGSHIHRKLVAFREYLPPHQQLMFALRDACCCTSEGVGMRVTRLSDQKFGRSLAEFMATSIGYPAAYDEKSPLSKIPADRDHLARSARIFTDRTVECHKNGIRDRSFIIATGLLQQANRANMKLDPSGVPSSLDVRRLLFRIKLMQALVWSGHTITSVQSLGIPQTTSCAFFAKHQVGTSRVSDQTDSVAFPTISTVNNFLKILGSFDASRELALDYFHLYEQSGIHTVVRRACDLNAVADEEDGILEEEFKSARATVEMLARAAGVSDFQRDRSLENPQSKSYNELSKLIGELGLTEHPICNTVNVARNLLRARNLFQSVIWFGAVMRR